MNTILGVRTNCHCKPDQTLYLLLEFLLHLIIIISDVRYEILFVLPITRTIIAHQIYHDTIIITICNSSPVWMIVEPKWLKTFDWNFISLSWYWQLYCDNRYNDNNAHHYIRYTHTHTHTHTHTYTLYKLQWGAE